MTESPEESRPGPMDRGKVTDSAITDSVAETEPAQGHFSGTAAKAALAAGIVIALLALSGLLVAETLFRIVVGWAFFLHMSAQQMEASGSGFNILEALVICAIATAVSAAVFRLSFMRQHNARLSWPGICLAVTAVVLLLFVTGTAFVGLSKNTIWLVRAEGVLTESGRQASRRSQSKNNLKQIGLAIHDYHAQQGSMPPGGTFGTHGEGRHGWITHLLPHLDRPGVYDRIDLTEPWDSEENLPHMQSPLPCLLNPGLPSETVTVKGNLAAAHYSANPLVLRPDNSLAFSQIHDGTSNTFVAGEIRDSIPPWGSPANWRDVDQPLNSPGAFGSPSTGMVQFLLADGTVRSVSGNISPEVLEALFTPSGNEPVGEL